MNAPDRFERFVLPEGLPKCAPAADQRAHCICACRAQSQAQYCCRVTVTPDTKVKNAATFRIEREDHTVGNTVTL